MAFSSSLFGNSNQNKSIFGDLRLEFGTYNAAGVTTGELTTGLSVVFAVILIPAGGAGLALASTVNETFPFIINASQPTITINTNSGETGMYIMIGK